MEIVHNTQEIISKQLFPKIFYHFGPMTSSWFPKQHFLIILSKF